MNVKFACSLKKDAPGAQPNNVIGRAVPTLALKLMDCSDDFTVVPSMGSIRSER
jgi:hypothetical protein